MSTGFEFWLANPFPMPITVMLQAPPVVLACWHNVFVFTS